MINVSFRIWEHGDEHTICTADLKELPRKDEQIWFLPSGAFPACKVADVCHWVSVKNDGSW